VKAKKKKSFFLGENLERAKYQVAIAPSVSIFSLVISSVSLLSLA